jgi:hemerythrin-like domain-containing protein
VTGKAEKKEEHPPAIMQPLGEKFVAALERDQKRLMRLCAMLEKVADGLPASCQHRNVPRLLAFLTKAYERHVFLHEKCLFPLLRSLASHEAALEPFLLQLELEHATDHALILEITSAYLNGPGHSRTEMLGYLLRSFFENCRRHQSWELQAVYPIARKNFAGGGIAAQHSALLRLSLGLKS